VDEQQRSLFLAPAPAQEAEPERPEPPAGPAAPLDVVEGGRRRRLQVLVVVALLIAGAIANRAGNERAEETAAQVRGGDRRTGAVPMPAPLAQSLRTKARLGPLLPQLTGTTLLLAAGTQVIVLDVDTGTFRNVQVADLDVSAGYPWGAPLLAVGDELVVRSQPPQAMVVPRTDGQPVRDLDAGSGGGLHPSTEPGRLWVEEVRGQRVLEEVDLTGAVQRTVPIPPGMSSIVWDGTGFVQTVDGTARAYPVAGGEPTDIGPGLAVAADPAIVALLRCARRDEPCPLELLDRRDGTVRTVVTEGEVVGFSAGTGTVPVRLSPDGRWLVIQAEVPPEEAEDGRGGPALALVDVAAATVRSVDPGTEAGVAVGAFSPDGRWLFLARTTGSVTARLTGLRLVDSARFDLDVELEVRTGSGLSMSAVPTSPADLGTGEG
jgi:hypothetical protein